VAARDDFTRLTVLTPDLALDLDLDLGPA